jgi:hypothetical protein
MNIQIKKDESKNDNNNTSKINYEKKILKNKKS